MKIYNSTDNSKYCGQFNTGERFGEWSVLESTIYFDEKSRAYVLCMCMRCHEPEYVDCYHLTNSNTHRCGKCSRQLDARAGHMNSSWDDTQIPNEVKKRYKKEGIDITDTEALQLLEDQNSTCFVSAQYITVRNDPLGISSYNARLVNFKLGAVDRLFWVHEMYEPIFRMYKGDHLFILADTIAHLTGNEELTGA